MGTSWKHTMAVEGPGCASGDPVCKWSSKASLWRFFGGTGREGADRSLTLAAGAKIESRQGDEFVVYMRIVKAKFMLSDVLNTEHTIRFTQVDTKRVYSRSYSKRINEVAAPGQAGERELPRRPRPRSVVATVRLLVF
jgi:hypothetical protein